MPLIGIEAPKTEVMQLNQGIAADRTAPVDAPRRFVLPPEVRRVDAYAIAVGLALGGIALRWALNPVLGEKAPLLLSVLPVIVAAWYGGVGPGMLAALVGGVLGAYMFIAPQFSWRIVDEAEILRLLLFGAESAIGSWLIGTRTRAMERQAVQHHELIGARAQTEQLNRDLERRVRERTELLEELNLQLEAFTYSVSHDLRAPLRGISGFAHALEEDSRAALDDKALSYISRISGEAARMDELIVDLLSYSRLQRKDLRLDPQPLRVLVRDALQEVDPQIEKSGARVAVVLPEVEVLAARPVAIQLLVNLLSNAIKFVPADRTPSIRVAAERRDGSVRVSVSDNGIGIDPRYQARIFEVFERLHGNDSYPGTGIGLAIVRKGAERMGGRVGVESSAGQGSTFWIDFKAAGES